MTGDGVRAVDTHGLARAAEYVAGVQRESGCIPWYEGGPADPWNHVESAMGLTVGGRYRDAERAYGWLRDRQLDDGSWWALYNGDAPAPESGKETHRAAYVATGVWHHYLVTRDREFLDRMWPTVSEAIDFALGFQRETGEVVWAVDRDGTAYEDALLSGCSSIYKSLDCAVRTARVLGEPRADWTDARERLGSAIRGGERFDRTWESKDDFAMNWFYPVLCGALTGSDARDRLDAQASRFVEPGLGCRCDAAEPWVTVAETCELVMATAGAGRRDDAAALFAPLARFQDDDGGFWIGYQADDEVIWPERKPTWTAGALLLAADALAGITPASGFFVDSTVRTGSD